MATTIAIKITNGEEWIGKHTHQLVDNGTVTLADPRRLQLVPTGKNGMGLALTPIFMSAVDLNSITIPTSHIIATISVEADFEKDPPLQNTGLDVGMSDRPEINRIHLPKFSQGRFGENFLLF